MVNEQLFQLPQRRESAVDTVVGRFRELILERKLRPGDLLPSEGALARVMNVSRSSVREAMKILSALGIVEIRRGDGTYVSGEVGASLLDPLLLRLILKEGDRRQLTQFRQMMEFDVARAALRNANAEAIAAVRQEYEKMERALSNSSQPHQWWAQTDMDFHRSLGRATGNGLIEQLYEFILQFFGASIENTYRQPHNAQRALACHRDIISALERGDEEELMAAVERSVEAWAAEEDQP